MDVPRDAGWQLALDFLKANSEMYRPQPYPLDNALAHALNAIRPFQLEPEDYRFGIVYTPDVLTHQFIFGLLGKDAVVLYKDLAFARTGNGSDMTTLCYNRGEWHPMGAYNYMEIIAREGHEACCQFIEANCNKAFPQREMQRLSAQDYLELFDPVKPPLLPAYEPEDGAAIRYSRYSIYQGDRHTGVGIVKGHTSKEEMLRDSSFVSTFSHNQDLRQIRLSVTHYTYGKGPERDATDRELSLVAKGALSELSEQTGHTVRVITRDEVELPPVSPLTQRGMSRYFTAASELAEERGFTVGGIGEESYLIIQQDGETVLELWECGAASVTPKLGDPEGYTEIKRLFEALCQLRESIPEVLEPRDYDKAEPDWEEPGFHEAHSTSATEGHYSPSNPWDAPGMTPQDFIRF